MSKNILIVDDVAFNRIHLAKQLRFYKGKALMDVLEAATAKEALDTIKETSPNVVITDINLPDATGFELFKRSKNITHNLPFLFVTAFPVKNFAEDLAKLGVSNNYIFTKPLAIETIRNVVYYFLGIEV